MSEIEHKPGIDGANPAVTRRMPFWLTPWKVAVSALFLAVIAFSLGVAGVPEKPGWFFNSRFFRVASLIAHPLSPLFLFANTAFVVGVFAMFDHLFRVAVILGWVATGLAVLMWPLALIGLRHSCDLPTTPYLLSSAHIWLMSLVGFAISATRMLRQEWRRCDRIRALLTEPERIGDVQMIQSASPAPTRITDRKAIDGTTEQG